MTPTHKLLLLPGDGIGPEVMNEVRRVIDWMGMRRDVGFEVADGLIGGAAIDAEGTPLSDETVARAKESDAVLLGAVGGPKWDNLEFDIRPERGLLRIRKDLNLFANLRPAVVFAALADASSLKADLVRDLDILIVRELTGGIYFGKPSSIEVHADGTRRGVNTLVYTTPEIRRVARVAFELARMRDRRVCSVDKANVLETSVLWREEVQRLRDANYADIELSHMYVDNCAMQLIRDPKQFDIILTDNMFGDILSDEASMLTGSLGMLPSACLGDAVATGRRFAVYEPVHGSAPDIAGQGLANPLAALLTFAMALRYSFEMIADAENIETACHDVLDEGLRTADIMEVGKNQVSTSEMGAAVLRALDRLAT
ncbi:MAG: 3-isopropylmalate dehydrogenase [Rhodospirillales bacterium]|jgi:3-isopropylmalate dehydrogenase|nr:3-isopropylmalate dehydrogenase [Rhodospirillales bacterium]MDP6804249.1 3-isopropylmalate dehydrogenase [Rhodospirillales bacterium]